MPIHRKICKVKTKGLRATGNLEPDIPLEKGISFVVHEYDEKEGTCIVEFFCSDNLNAARRARTRAQLNDYTKHRNVIARLRSHPKSPEKIVKLSLMTRTPKESEIKNHDPIKKTFELHGKKINYKRREKSKDTEGRDVYHYVIEEG